MRGYCHLTQVPLRAEARSASEMVSQLLYGESYEILDQQDEWSFVKLDYDGYEGWLSNSSIKLHDGLDRSDIQHELFAVHPINDSIVITSMGSGIFHAFLEYDEIKVQHVKELASRFLGVPYLWGGRTFTGIDCSGLTQVVYKCLGVALLRDASQQVKQGTAIRFEQIIEGDLVFFDHNSKVSHVGIALSNNKIIHAHGQVRIDTLTKKGIFNEDKNELTHNYHSARRMR